MAILIQFLYRLSFGLAAAMAATSAKQVTSGYFRVHSYVLLGLNALAVAVAYGAEGRFALWPPITAAAISYAAAVMWLYEKPRPGRVALELVAAVTLAAAWLAAEASSGTCVAEDILRYASPVAGGLVLGTTMAAMLLGHWYLNTPTMQLAPLKRLIVLMAAALLLRAVLSLAGLGLQIGVVGLPGMNILLFAALRWLAGLIAAGVCAWMAWQTLKVPNTQSATGILYVAVIVTFLGELTAQFLANRTLFPGLIYPL